jgi:hypothetical protein
MNTQREYYQLLATAYVRGKLKDSENTTHPELFVSELDDLSENEIQQLFTLAQKHELRLHRFNRIKSSSWRNAAPNADWISRARSKRLTPAG